LNLDGRTVLLTGASGGIGQVIARTLHGRGASLLLTARRREVLDELCADLGERAEAVPADLADRADVARLAERARSVDVLVANAALPAAGPLDWFEAGEIDRAIDVNLRAPIQLARAAVPAMIERGAGHVVFVSSLLGKLARAGSALYSGTKFGLRGVALGLREDMEDTPVGVTTVLPGFVRDAGMYADTGVDFPPGTPTSTPQEVADAVVRGIERDEGEIIVAPRALRVGAFIATIAPRVGAKAMRRRNPPEQTERMARAQASKR
jgi:short-subunit dehydrogenase